MDDQEQTQIERIRLYKSVFDNTDGKAILRELFILFSIPGETAEAQRYMGQMDVITHIMQTVDITAADIVRMTSVE